MPPLLGLEGVAARVGAQTLFEDVSITIDRGDRLALVGRNGSGKSTLLRILAGETEPDAGRRFIDPRARIGTLPQSPDLSPFASLADYVVAGLPAERAGERHVADAALEELGLDPERSTEHLSGGEERRAALARAFVSEPTVLLLDEPTNHLDLAAIAWLEKRLDAFSGAAVLVSHDRALLEKWSRSMLWLMGGGARSLARGFADFETWSAEVYAGLERENERRVTRLKLEESWLVHGVTARRKRNERRLANLRTLRAEHRERFTRQGTAAIAAAGADVSGDLVIEAERLGFERGERTILRPLDLRLRRGDRLALIGPNGAGKTTLIRLLMKDLAPTTGTVRHGTRLSARYLDQRFSGFDAAKTPWEILAPQGGDQILVDGRPKHVVAYLKDFLFSEGQARQSLARLSGGERNRLRLAKFFAEPSNFLVLDEPTNDLDVETLELLEEVLTDYPGTVLFVSHDRTFIDRLATATLAFEGEGRTTLYPGGYSDYLRQRPAPGEAPRTAARARPIAEKPKDKPKSKLSYKEARALDALEAEMPRLEAEIARAEAVLADPGLYAKDKAAFARTAAALEAARARLGNAEEEWLALTLLRDGGF